MKDNEGQEPSQDGKKEIELDKLVVPNSPGKPRKPSGPAKETEKLEPSRVATGIVGKITSLKAWAWEKIHNLKPLPGLAIRNKVFICGLLAGLVAALPVVLYCLIWADTPEDDNGRERGIMYVVGSSLGERNYVRFKLFIPFKDDAQKGDLMEKLYKTKLLLSNSESHPSVAEPLTAEDLNAVKRYILDIVNDVTGIPVGALDLQELFLD